MHTKDQKQLLNLGKKHQKRLEFTSINAVSYKPNNHAYYIAFYKSKFRNALKGCAIISPDTDNKQELELALAPLMYFSISSNGALKSAKRASLDIDVLKEIELYLKQMIETGPINQYNVSYKQAYEVMKQIILLQHDVVQLYHDVKALDDQVENTGYFTDDTIEQMIHYVIRTDLIQYRQISMHYDQLDAFDKVYAHTEHIKPSHDTIDLRLLVELTSEKAQADLENSLSRLEKGQSVKQMTDEEIYQMWIKGYKRDLEEEVFKMKGILRYP
ncbi:hypothetical protein [Lentibacillus saliphilus]|uniref:hypothetical protein n=1 Tax=Lentibacillus saliphilus TaxID=2737028 RepID=UPI001C30F830|nr:hypothetical protein [Lentibacillus saliphilus]